MVTFLGFIIVHWKKYICIKHHFFFQGIYDYIWNTVTFVIHLLCTLFTCLFKSHSVLLNLTKQVHQFRDQRVTQFTHTLSTRSFTLLTCTTTLQKVSVFKKALLGARRKEKSELSGQHLHSKWYSINNTHVYILYNNNLFVSYILHSPQTISPN